MVNWAKLLNPTVAMSDDDLECQAVLCKNKLMTECKMHGRGKGHCKYFEGKYETCFYYYADLEHCGNAKAQLQAYK